MTRPKAISRFELLVLVAFGLRCVGLVANSQVEFAGLAAVDSLTATGLGGTLRLAGVVAPPILALLASRRKSRVAKWIFVVWIALISIAFVIQLLTGQFMLGPFTTMSIAILTAYLSATWILFTPQVRRWFRGERGVSDLAEDFSCWLYKAGRNPALSCVGRTERNETSNVDHLVRTAVSRLDPVVADPGGACLA